MAPPTKNITTSSNLTAAQAGLAEALGKAFDERTEFVKACDEVEAMLGPRRSPSREVARMIEPWLTKRSA